METNEPTSEDFDRETDDESSPVEDTETDPANPAETDESELTGSADPGTGATPEGTAEVDEEDEDRGDV